MLSAAAAKAMAQQHRTPEDDAVSTINKELSDMISQASVEGKFHESYILPAVLSTVPSYDIRIVHSRIIKGLRRAGYRVVINGPEIVLYWGKDTKDEEEIRVEYSNKSKKMKSHSFPRKSSKKKSVKFTFPKK